MSVINQACGRKLRNSFQMQITPFYATAAKCKCEPIKTTDHQLFTYFDVCGY